MRGRTPSNRPRGVRGRTILIAFLAMTFNAPAAQFLRGDVDGSCRLQPLDAYWILAYLFLGKSDEVLCLDAADVDDSGRIDLADAIYLLNHVLSEGPAPPPPFLDAGEDPTPPSLGCERPFECGPQLEIAGLRLGRPSTLVLVVDRSYTMWGAPFEIAQREIRKLISTLKEITSFALVFFDRTVVHYPANRIPEPATEEYKRSALEYVASVQCRWDTCPHAALVAGIYSARLGPGFERVVVYLGNGGGQCQGADENAYLDWTLERIPPYNMGEVRIFVVGIGAMRPWNEKFLRELASQNGGAYAHLAE